jgi:deoxyribodipyrimidine photo-lyase
MLVERGLTAQSFDGNLLFDPTLVRNQSGQPFRVFTAYWRSCMNRPVAAAKKAPRTLPAPETWPASLDVADLGLDPAADWTHGFCVTWRPGEAGAQEQLKRFRKASLEKYSTGRDRPGTGGTSRLSPHLRFGEISPRAIWHATVSLPGGDAYVRQLAWREFAHYLLLHHPGSPDEPLRPAFESFPWKGDLRTLEAWQQGLTGYPLVDAGMRELWRTGWMHNRVRMVAASFLVKHLLIDWRDGAVWFWDTLVDASLANNTMSWQWVAGCGADAAPYFRIFNPVMQGEKFDPAGEYIRRWVPELAGLSKEWIHKPWKAPASVLRTAGVKLGKSYPRPIIDHDEARRRALTALSTIKGS